MKQSIGWSVLGGLVLVLLSGCHCFHPLVLQPGPKVSTSRHRLHPRDYPPRRLKLMPLLASPDENEMDTQGSPESTDLAAPYKPRFLWWTTSREEEIKAINLGVNAGFLAGVTLIAIIRVLSVNAEASRGWTMSEFFLRLPLDNWDGYSVMLREYPVMVKACTSGIIYALGDWVAQTVAGTDLSDIKRGRVLRSSLAGLFLHGPLSHVWYDLCEDIFDVIGWNDYWWVPGPKIITDQLLWGPFWNAVYISVTGILKKDSLETIKTAVTSTAVPLVLAGLRLWPLAHLVTYGLVPKENRLLWVDAVEVAWVTILSKQAADQAAEEEKQKEREKSLIP